MGGNPWFFKTSNGLQILSWFFPFDVVKINKILISNYFFATERWNSRNYIFSKMSLFASIREDTNLSVG